MTSHPHEGVAGTTSDAWKAGAGSRPCQARNIRTGRSGITSAAAKPGGTTLPENNDTTTCQRGSTALGAISVPASTGGSTAGPMTSSTTPAGGDALPSGYRAHAAIVGAKPLMDEFALLDTIGMQSRSATRRRARPKNFSISVS